MIYWDKRGIRQLMGLHVRLLKSPPCSEVLERKGHVSFTLPPFRILCLNLLVVASRLRVVDSSAHQRKIVLLLVGPGMRSK